MFETLEQCASSRLPFSFLLIGCFSLQRFIWRLSWARSRCFDVNHCHNNLIRKTTKYFLRSSEEFFYFNLWLMCSLDWQASSKTPGNSRKWKICDRFDSSVSSVQFIMKINLQVTFWCFAGSMPGRLHSLLMLHSHKQHQNVLSFIIVFQCWKL